MTTRVLVVDDTAVFRRIVSEALAGIPDVEVVGVASNGKLALTQMAALRPDLITLDIEMPVMDGIAFLESVNASGSAPGVIVLSSQTVRGGKLTVRALELGAFDFITKPSQATQEENLAILRNQLQATVRAFQQQQFSRSECDAANAVKRTAVPAFSEPKPLSIGKRHGSPIVLIGVSTGGPTALAQLLPALPSDLGVPVFIVQHMPPLFTKALAESLGTKSKLRVCEAVDGETATTAIYIAPGGSQMKLTPGPKGEIVVRVTADPPENNCRPSVDYLFRSAALRFPGRAIAAILTGMGNDGTQGLRMLRRSGCISIAQDEASCVVFGMPKEAIAAGVVDTVLPLNMIGAAIVRSVRECVS